MSVRAALAAVLGSGLVAAAVVATAPAAGAAEVSPRATVTLRNVATGFCLDSNADMNVYTHGCNGGSYQKWVTSGGVLRDLATGFCLDSNADMNVYTHNCNGGSFQKWNISGGVLRNVATGFCLDSNANREVYTHDCNGGNYQKWYIG